KTVLLSLDGRVLASATRTYPTRRGADGSATQDAADWVDAMVATTRAVLGDAPGYDVAAIGITAPAHNVVLVPRDGGAPPPVLLWSDRRPAAEVERLLDAHPGYFERTLVRLSTGWTLPQLAWMRRER